MLMERQRKRLEDHKQVKNFFKLKNATGITKEPNKASVLVIIITPVDSMSAAGSISSNAFHTKSFDVCFQDSVCQKAEIMWALKHACNGLSDNSGKKVLLVS